MTKITQSTFVIEGCSSINEEKRLATSHLYERCFIPGSIPNFWVCRFCYRYPIKFRPKFSVIFNGTEAPGLERGLARTHLKLCRGINDASFVRKQLNQNVCSDIEKSSDIKVTKFALKLPRRIQTVGNIENISGKKRNVVERDQSISRNTTYFLPRKGLSISNSVKKKKMK